MRRILTTLLLTALAAGTQAQTLDPADYVYPIRGVDGTCSSNFGEMRPGHFHSGVDIRTGGVEGKPLVAVADGYVSRIAVWPANGAPNRKTASTSSSAPAPGPCGRAT